MLLRGQLDGRPTRCSATRSCLVFFLLFFIKTRYKVGVFFGGGVARVISLDGDKSKFVKIHWGLLYTIFFRITANLNYTWHKIFLNYGQVKDHVPLQEFTHAISNYWNQKMFTRAWRGPWAWETFQINKHIFAWNDYT